MFFPVFLAVVVVQLLALGDILNCPYSNLSTINTNLAVRAAGMINVARSVLSRSTINSYLAIDFKQVFATSSVSFRVADFFANVIDDMGAFFD